LDLGIAPEKLILGVPWYGYDYPCSGQNYGLDTKICLIEEIPFRGVNCSDAAGREISYYDIMEQIHLNVSVSQVTKDTSTNAYYFNYINHKNQLH